MPFVEKICWFPERISHVINPDAIKVDSVDFLATHTPIKNLHYLKKPMAIKAPDEESLLEELKRCETEDEHAFVLVRGAPGTGKSHLIRWLYTRYDSERHPHEKVFLIERSNLSLRNALLQIIDLFDPSLFVREREQLRRATITLSNEAFANALVNGFQSAVDAVKRGDTLVALGDLPGMGIVESSPLLLLDQHVRATLMRPNAPIDRLARQLRGEETSRGNEMAQFQESDFKFSVKVLEQIKNGGYEDASKLAEALYYDLDMREQMATYLNRLLNYAVGSTLRLTVDDLKRVFTEIRLAMRNQAEPQSLILFIEDIAVFTGVDAGLVEVLIDDHRGRNKLARMTSVVGVTDYYYNTHIPDNIRDRVTHLLTFDEQQMDSDFLLDLAARYLNAIRVPRNQLQTWAQSPGNTPPPNACLSCPFIDQCHPAFGAESLEVGDVGLYPFNARALQHLYEQRVAHDENARTPRHFLRDVVKSVMQNHASGIGNGQFPPKAEVMLDDVYREDVPTLKVNQRALLTQQVPKPFDQQRIISLAVYWGNRTLNSDSAKGEQIAVGEVPHAVFNAFGVPFIKGANVFTPPELEDIPASPNTPSKPAAIVSTTQKYADEIERWYSGANLTPYGDLTKLLRDFVQDAINWDELYIPTSTVVDRIKPVSFYIDGTPSKAPPPPFFPLARNESTLALLHALDALNSAAPKLPPEQFGAHLLTLNVWLSENQAEIVKYVLQPNAEISAPTVLRLIDTLWYDCVMLAVLQGDLTPEACDPIELFRQVVTSAKKNAFWQPDTTRPQAWQDAMQRVTRYVTPIRRDFLDALNRGRRGIVRDVNKDERADLKYIDAEAILSIVARHGWSMPSLDLAEIKQPKDSGWQVAGYVYQQLQPHFLKLLEGEYQALVSQLEQLQVLLGDDTPESAFAAIQVTITDLAAAKRFPKFTPNENLSADRLKAVLRKLTPIHGERDQIKLLLRLSNAGNMKENAANYVSYLTEFTQALEAQALALEHELGGQTLDQDLQTLADDVEIAYDTLFKLLEQF